MLAAHDRIDDQRAGKRSAGDGFDDGGVSERAGLDSLRGKILEDGVDLFRNERRIENLDARHAGRILDRNQGDRRRTEDVQLMESFEVGLDAGATSWVGTGDGEGDRDHSPISCLLGLYVRYGLGDLPFQAVLARRIRQLLQ